MILLGLGSNIGNKTTNIISAIRLLKATKGITIDRMSSLYRTKPVGVIDQPEFLNAVISIITTLTPHELLKVCLGIEKAMGRVRTKKWGPRNIDIDILLYDDVIMNSAELCLPHPHLHERNFVLVPLLEIAENLPIYNGLTVSKFLEERTEVTDVHFYKKLELD